MNKAQETTIRVLALNHLPVKRGGRTAEELAALVGTSRKTIDNIYCRAMQKLRAKAFEELGFASLRR